MALGSVRKVTVLALVFFAFVFMPNMTIPAVARGTGPIAVYEPAMSGPSPSSTPNMPLPIPAPGYVPNPAPVSGVLKVVIIAA